MYWKCLDTDCKMQWIANLSSEFRKVMKPLTLVFIAFLIFSSALSDIRAQSMDFDILKGRKKVEIPFEYYHNFIIVQIKMFGLLPMHFIFDTGAEHTILFKRQYTDLLDVKYDRRIPLVGSDLSRELYALVARNITLQVEGMPILDRDILVLEENYFNLDEITGRSIDGILGGEFFKNVIVNIDFAKRRLTLIANEHFQKPGKGFKMINIHLKANKPYVTSTVRLSSGHEVELELLIDTGAGLPLLLHNNTDERLGLPEKFIRGKLGVGLGGYVEGYVGRIAELDVHGLKFQSVPTSFQDISESIISAEISFRNGILGNQILGRFNIYLDYIREKAYLKPLKRSKRKFRMDRSGLIVFAAGQELNLYVVQDIIEGSPADECGIKKGDIIKKIQGFPAKLFSLGGVLRLLTKKDGKKIRLQLIRDGVTIKKDFKLRDLI